LEFGVWSSEFGVRSLGFGVVRECENSLRTRLGLLQMNCVRGRCQCQCTPVCHHPYARPIVAAGNPSLLETTCPFTKVPRACAPARARRRARSRSVGLLRRKGNPIPPVMILFNLTALMTRHLRSRARAGARVPDFRQSVAGFTDSTDGLFDFGNSEPKCALSFAFFDTSGAIR
jgi:hypothetical protein